MTKLEAINAVLRPLGLVVVVVDYFYDVGDVFERRSYQIMTRRGYTAMTHASRMTPSSTAPIKDEARP